MTKKTSVEKKRLDLCEHDQLNAISSMFQKSKNLRNFNTIQPQLEISNLKGKPEEQDHVTPEYSPNRSHAGDTPIALSNDRIKNVCENILTTDTEVN